MALFIYGTATNTGKGFFTHQDRQTFTFQVNLQMSGSLVTMKKAHYG